MTSKHLIVIICTLFIPLLIQATNEPVVCFETDSLLIKADTTSFFLLVDKHYSEDHRQLIKSEVRYRLSVSKNNEAKMNGMNLNCYEDKERRAYLASCLNYEESMVLMYTKQAKVYYKYTMKEIPFIKIKKKGSKLFGKVDRLYIDKTTNKLFFRDLIYDHKWWKRNRGCKLPYFEHKKT